MIRNFFFSIFIMVTFTYALLASESISFVEKHGFSITTEQLHIAEKRLNDDQDPKLYEDTLLILRYLSGKKFSHEQIAQLFHSSVEQVEYVLTTGKPCNLLERIHVYYYRGGVSVLEIEQQEDDSTLRWLTRLVPCLRSAPVGYKAIKKGF
jgi:hypothetical protein